MGTKVKPFSRKKANRISDFLQSLAVTDRTELFKEAQEYETMKLWERKVNKEIHDKCAD